MRDWRLQALQTEPLHYPMVAVFIGEGRGVRHKAPLLRHVGAADIRNGPVALAPELQEPCPGGTIAVEIPITMAANGIAALAREFTLNGMGVILVAPGGCNGLHAALGITDERLFIEGEVDLAPMVTAVADDVSFARAYERFTAPNVTMALVPKRGAANG